MANIMINKVCNLKCPYCFANEFVNNPEQISNVSNKGNITVDNFKKALDFATSCNNKRVGIIGGEPTLHPNFKELMEILIFDNRVAEVSLFTNGVHLDRYFNILVHPKIGILINLNSPNDIGTKTFNKIIDNLDHLIKHYYKKERITLGINMYKPNFDFNYMIEALNRYNLKHVRTAIAVPNTLDKRHYSQLDYFREMKPSVFNFFKELQKHGIMPTYDCNYMPTCVTTAEEKKWLQEFWKYEKGTGKRCNITDNPKCSPVIDILPDLSAVRCFGLSDEENVMTYNFENIGELDSYFVNRFDSISYNVHNSYECQICDHRQKMKCMGGCLAFKVDKINKVVEFAHSIN